MSVDTNGVVPESADNPDVVVKENVEKKGKGGNKKKGYRYTLSRLFSLW
jgi:hypothetical protein